VINIDYLLACKNNPLYNGDYVIDGVNKTYGHQSFVYDFVLTCVEQNAAICIYVDNLISFPFSTIFSQYPLVKIFQLELYIARGKHIVILDSLNNEQIDKLLLNGTVIGIVHNYLLQHPQSFYRKTDFIVCFTEMAKKIQSKYKTPEKIIVSPQGIHLKRFISKNTISSSSIETVLLYSRMDSQKGRFYIELIEVLLSTTLRINLLSDGMYYSEAVNKFGDQINIIPHVPCFEIHSIINKYDLIISNGRGVMEGMASGKPTIAAGIRYCGFINESNIEKFFSNNFTGSYLPITTHILSDLEFILNGYYKNNSSLLAEKYFDNKYFFNSILAL
jgi:hypothetical protein